jgi:hypothetical protein
MILRKFLFQTWTFLGSIVNKSYDFVMCGYVINYDRNTFVDFSMPLFENRIGNYINTALQTKTFDWMFFTRIFRPSAWLNVVGLFILFRIVDEIFKKCGVKESSVANKSMLFLLGTLFLLCQAYYW